MGRRGIGTEKTKGDTGKRDCQLRRNESVSKHLTLNSVAVILLEIASLLSPVYAMLTKQGVTPEMKHRWIAAELVGQRISSVQKIGDLGGEVEQIVEGILCPYKSTMIKQITKEQTQNISYNKFIFKNFYIKLWQKLYITLSRV